MATAEKPIWFQSSREQLDALLLEVCDGLQLRPSRHELAVERYGTVNEILEKAEALSGSFALGFSRKARWRWAPRANQSRVLTILTLSFKSMPLTGGGILSRGLVPCTNA